MSFRWSFFLFDFRVRWYLETPRILESNVQLKGCRRPLRQLTVIDLGHEEPTILLTNLLKRSLVQLIALHAQRMLTENGIAEPIDFFHIDALSSMVGLKVGLDLHLTLMASSLYRLTGDRIGREYRNATARTLFRKLFNLTGDVTIIDGEIVVDLTRRARTPMLVQAGLAGSRTPVRWLGGKEFRQRQQSIEAYPDCCANRSAMQHHDGHRPPLTMRWSSITRNRGLFTLTPPFAIVMRW